MKFQCRLTIYSLVTASIELPAILMLYSYGYPSNPSSYMTWAFLIAYNLFFIMVAFSALGGPIPGQGPRDMSLDLVWGAISMFIIIAAIGETINWLTEEVKKAEKKAVALSFTSKSIISLCACSLTLSPCACALCG